MLGVVPVNESASADLQIAALTSAPSSAGFMARTRAATPATCGVAMLVPRRLPCWPSRSLRVPLALGRKLPASVDPTHSPGAATSGLVRPSRVGPSPEKLERPPATLVAPGLLVPPLELTHCGLLPEAPAVRAL